MRIVVNRLPALGIKTGIGHYTAELLRHLWEQGGDEQIDLFPRGMMWRLRSLASQLSTGPRQPSEAPAQPSWLARQKSVLTHCGRQAARLLLQASFRATCSWNKYHLYHEPNFIPLPSDVPTVSTIADLSVLLHPQWHPAQRVDYFEKNFHRGTQRSQHFLAISEYGRQEIIQHLGIAPERVTRTYMGVRAGLQPLPTETVQTALVRMGLPQQYLLYLGTIEPRKNILTLLKAYCAMPESLRSRWPLVLVGAWGWKAGDVADYFHREAQHRGVIHVGYIPDDQLAVLYNGARALVFPSFYEGFGLPPIEMMACGGAVLTSTAGSLVEVTQPIAHHVEPLDLDGWREALIRVVSDNDWWQQLRRGTVEHACGFTWSQCAADTLRVYRQVAGVARPVYPCPLQTAEPSRRAG